MPWHPHKTFFRF